MSEYGNEEIQDDNEEIEEEQELDDIISNNQEIKIEDFEPINKQNIELEGENFEPSYSIETDIHDYQFEIPNNTAFENTYEDFEPTYSEKLTFECRIGPEPPRPAFIGAIIDDPTLSTWEKIEMLKEKQSKLWDNSEISISERDRISKAIDDAISELKVKQGGYLDSSISPNRDTAGKHETSNLKDNQNPTENKINNQENFESKQSEKEDLDHDNKPSKEFKQDKNTEKLLKNQIDEIQDNNLNEKLDQNFNGINQRFLSQKEISNKESKERPLNVTEIIEFLTGNISFNQIDVENNIFQKYKEKFLKDNPDFELVYRKGPSNHFRDYLIKQKDIKSQISKLLENNKNILNSDLSLKNNIKRYIESYHKICGRYPSTRESFQTYLNSTTSYITNCRSEAINEIENPKKIEKEYEDTINANELVLLHDNKSNLYRLTEIRNAQIQEYDSTIGLNSFSQRSEKVNVDQLIKLTKDRSLNIICKHGEISVSESHALLSVDNNLNITEINAKLIKPGTSILIPRIFEVKENSAPLDLSNCGNVVKKNNKEYIREAKTECYRFIEKNFEVGYILGQYCSEGSMNQVTITCNSDKKLVEQVNNFVQKNFGLNPRISKHKPKDYKTIYELNSRTKLAKKVFTEGLGLKPKHAPYKQIPPFLYNAPMDCVKGFLASYLKGDGSIGDYHRKNSPKRDVYMRYNTSSRKMAFGLNFLLKRFGIDATISKREFDDIEHPNWHDNYSLRITGKRNLNILRQVIPKVPEYGKFARGKAPEINLNPWIKKLDNEMKEKYGISLRMLVEKQKIPHMVARCAQENNLKNLSEGNLLKTLDYLKKQNYKTPTIEKLKIFENNTLTRVNKIEKNNNQENIYNLSIADNNSYIAGIGHIYIKKIN